MISESLDLTRTTGEPLAFYPPIEPYNSGRLRVSELHDLYFEEVGNPQGKPAVLLHGAPEQGLSPCIARLLILPNTASCCSTNEAVARARLAANCGRTRPGISWRILKN